MADWCCELCLVYFSSPEALESHTCAAVEKQFPHGYHRSARLVPTPVVEEILVSDEINALSGPALDAAVAESVLHEPRPTRFDHAPGHIESVRTHGSAWVCYLDFDRGDVCEWTPRRFSQDWGAAGTVVDYLLLDGWTIGLSIEDEPFCVRLTKGRQAIIAYGDRSGPDNCTATFCRAALQAMKA